MLLHKDEMLINSRPYDEIESTPIQFAFVLFSNDERDWEIGIFLGTVDRAIGYDTNRTFLGRNLNEREHIEREYKYCRVVDRLPCVEITDGTGKTKRACVWGSSNPTNYIADNNTILKREDYDND